MNNKYVTIYIDAFNEQQYRDNSIAEKTNRAVAAVVNAAQSDERLRNASSALSAEQLDKEFGSDQKPNREPVHPFSDPIPGRPGKSFSIRWKVTLHKQDSTPPNSGPEFTHVLVDDFWDEYSARFMGAQLLDDSIILDREYNSELKHWMTIEQVYVVVDE